MKTSTAFQHATPTEVKQGTRKVIILLIFVYILTGSLCYAQSRPATDHPVPILFKNGVFRVTRNIPGEIGISSNPGRPAITGQNFLRDSLPSVHYKNKYYVLLQFDKLPDLRERKELASMGLRLFDYIPGRAFLAELEDGISLADLNKYALSGIYPLPVDLKISPRLLVSETLYAHNTEIVVGAGFFGTLTRDEVQRELEEAGASIVTTRMRPDHAIFITATRTVLQKIAALPFINYLGPQSIRSYPLNYNNRAAHGVDAVSAPSGRNLQGDGITVGIGDDSDPYSHVDFTGRLIGRYASTFDTHGIHVSGTVGGGGILNPKYKGMAPHAELVNQYYSDILFNAPTYVTDYDMLLTSNSYTAYNYGCQFDGEYDLYSQFVDGQLLSYPNLLHVFAAGNDGAFSCSPYTVPYATIKSGFQSAKNALDAGNLNNFTNLIGPGSSCGPTSDGRLKPDIVAGGTGIMSTFPNNTYGNETGTSMASPTVTGALVLLDQRYRQLHGNADPSAALVKALICNNATDLGNPGPDFIYGFGSLNVRTAIESMENNQYYPGTANNGSTATHTISGVPAGLQQIRIMLYWPDYPAAPYAAATLVNNLDLTVSAPDATVHYPLILNPNVGHVTDVAIEGVDNVNNIEQVVINHPPAGNFTITVSGTNVPAGAQDYVVTWQEIAPSVRVEHPSGNETLVPGEAEAVRWNAYDGGVNTFTIEYSPDNGSSWTMISSSAPANSLQTPWTVPSTATNQGRIRVTRNGAGYTAMSDYPFTILGQPVVTASNPCQGYAQLNWSSIPSAVSYDIMSLTGDTMKTIANTAATSYLLGNLNRDSSYWLAVRAVNAGNPGRRSLAVNIIPAGGSCSLAALDNDYTIDSLIGPLPGRAFSSTALGSSTPIQIEVKNLGTIAPGVPFDLSYRVNGGTVVTESSSAVIAANGAYSYTFSQTYDFSSPGLYTLQVWVSNPGDPQPGNDTLSAVIKQLHNDPISLSPAFTENFEAATTAAAYTVRTVGLTGLDRWDFNAGNLNGRARTFVNTGFARSGSNCATLDEIHHNSASTADSLTGTFNLSGYSASDQLWLDFYYKNHGIDFSLPGNRVWIRGNDQAAWIPIYVLDSSLANIGIYQQANHIDITGTLAAASPVQSVSSSFQIKFGEQGFTSANSVVPDGDLDDGYSFDDITLTRAINDINVASLQAPDLSGICGLSNAETIRVKVKNYSPVTATNIPITYSVKGVTVTESIPSINPFDSVIYTFTHTADLSSYTFYTLQIWSDFPGDNYHSNDTLAVTFQTVPVISTFPYLEGFESNNGYWYTGGVNDSWQWGTPSKTLINKAANGTKCWVTNLTGDYNSNELSYLYSPCFDLSSLASPVLSFSHIFQTEDDCACDYHWVEYSTDGKSWTNLGAAGNGTNWYDDVFPESWQLSNTKWHVSSYDIPVNGPEVRFRIVMSSDPATTYEGVGIDDIHVFDKAPVYSGADIGKPGLTLPVAGNSWVNFDVGGHRVVSINPNGQDLGSTTVKAFLHAGAVQNFRKQYFLARNVVITPSNVPAGKVSVRLYFLDSEADSLMHASGCDSCATIADPYQSGVMQFSSLLPATEEDSTLNNDSVGSFHFLAPHQDVSVIPYDNGYYAEYAVSGFSEFWIDGGNITQNASLPFQLLSFTGVKAGNSGQLQWTTLHESGISRYILEKSPDSLLFSPIDSVNAIGDIITADSYHSTDKELWNGNNYYRLKIISSDGEFIYSPLCTITDNDNRLVVTLYPNPVHTGNLTISSTSNIQSIQLTDAAGKVILRSDTHGFVITLPAGRLARGTYFLNMETDAGRKVEKVVVK